MLLRFWSDETGQDILEYALLTATIGLAGAAIWSAMGVTVGDTYDWNIDRANDHWQSPPPSGP
jgi:Flp pilus assembly pilin Flp